MTQDAGEKELGCISNICGYCQVGCFCDWDGVCRSPQEIAERVAREEEKKNSRGEIMGKFAKHVTGSRKKRSQVE